jgi:hypothetical protein
MDPPDPDSDPQHCPKQKTILLTELPTPFFSLKNMKNPADKATTENAHQNKNLRYILDRFSYNISTVSLVIP